MLLTWFAAAVLAGAAFAWAAHRYNDHHPAEVGLAPGAGTQSPPIINMAAIRVGGDAGGLIFVVGAVVILAISLPSVRWFIVASAVIAPLVAVGLRAWRAR